MNDIQRIVFIWSDIYEQTKALDENENASTPFHSHSMKTLPYAPSKTK